MADSSASVQGDEAGGLFRCYSAAYFCSGGGFSVAATAGLADAIAPHDGWTVVALIGILFGVFFSPFAFLLQLAIVYRGFRALSPLRDLDPDATAGTTSPASAVGLMLIPLVNLLWIYALYPRFATRANRLIDLSGVPLPPLSAERFQTFAHLVLASAIPGVNLLAAPFLFVIGHRVHRDMDRFGRLFRPL